MLPVLCAFTTMQYMQALIYFEIVQGEYGEGSTVVRSEEECVAKGWCVSIFGYPKTYDRVYTVYGVRWPIHSLRARERESKSLTYNFFHFDIMLGWWQWPPWIFKYFATKKNNRIPKDFLFYCFVHRYIEKKFLYLFIVSFYSWILLWFVFGCILSGGDTTPSKAKKKR